jgi:hypothetical protein
VMRVAALVAACLGWLMWPAPEALTLKAEKIGSRIDVTVGDAFFTSYQFRADEKYPFFFPVNAPGSGASVTSLRNGEYPHHSSLFFGCDRVNGGNYWQEGLERGRIVSRGPVVEVAAGNAVVIADTCDWKRPGAEQPIRDTRRIVVTAPSKAVRQIDVELALTALADVTIEKTNHSLFSVRLDPDLSVRLGGTMVNARGDAGEKATFGQASPWMAAYGRRGAGAVEGLALFQHPASAWFPSPWFTRDYGFLSPTPLYWPANGVATKLAKGQSLRLRYRVVVFSGDPGEIDFAARFAAYAAEK